MLSSEDAHRDSREPVRSAVPPLAHGRGVPFQFQRLASWELSPALSDAGRCVLEMACHEDQTEIGRIILDVRQGRPELNLNRLAVEYADVLKNGGVHLRGAPVISIEPPEGFLAAAIYAPPARYEGHEFDAPVLLLQHPAAVVALSLFGPSRQESPEWWAINKQAFEIVRDSLVIGNPDTVAGDVPQQAVHSQAAGG